MKNWHTLYSSRFGRLPLLVTILLCAMSVSLFMAHKTQSSTGHTEPEDGISGIKCEARQVWKDNSSKKFSITSGGMGRFYTVNLPAKFDSTRPYPVIFAFTGKNMKPEYLAKESGLNALPAIIVYPHSLKGLDGAVAWQGAPYSPKGVDDVGFVRDIIKTLEQKLCIDSNQIYSVGISNGGGMSWLLSCHASDKIAAFVMIAGAYYYPEKSCIPERPSAILNIHGRKDTVIPYGGSQRKKLPSNDYWVMRRAEFNQCKDTPPEIRRTSSTTIITTWQECADNATVQNIELTNIGHYWPKSINIDNTKSRNISESTAQYIWFFLRSHPMTSR